MHEPICQTARRHVDGLCIKALGRVHALDSLRPGLDRPTANWFWLANLSRSEQILTIGEPDPVLAEQLARHFAVVWHQVLPRDTDDHWRLPFPDAGFDCVAVSA